MIHCNLGVVKPVHSLLVFHPSWKNRVSWGIMTGRKMATQALVVSSAASQVASAFVPSPREAFFPLCLAGPLPAMSLAAPAVCWNPLPHVGKKQWFLAADKTPQGLEAGKCLKSPHVRGGQVHSANCQESWEVAGMRPCPLCGIVSSEGKKSTGACCPHPKFKVLALEVATNA